MEKGIYGLAFLQYNFEKNRRDIIDAYIPLVCHCLVVMEADRAEVMPLRDSLKEEFGLTNITDGAILSIFDRMSRDRYGLLNVSNDIYYVNKQKVAVEGVKPAKENLIAGFDEIVSKIEEYSHKYQVSFSHEDIEKGLFHFMDQYDVDLTLGNIKELCSQLTKYNKNEKQLKYLISKYLIEAIKNDPQAVEMMVKLAKGHAISSLISLQNLNKMNGALKDVEIFLDAPIIFNLLELNDKANYHLTAELMQILKDNGAKFCIFDHNHNEVINTMTDARDRLLTGDYDLRKSSRLLRMAYREKMSSLQIGLKIDEYSELLGKWEVTIQGRPELKEGGQDIDVRTLSEIIKGVYTKNGARDLFYSELSMLETDLDSITYIFRLKGNVACTNLKNSKALLLTTNRVISAASHDKRINFLNHAIPACATDVFLSTILWTNYPSSNDDLNQKLLISECYNNIELDDQLMIRFYDQLKEQSRAGLISEAQYLQATTSRIALDLLADKTLNDVTAYTDRTTKEVLEIIEMEHRSDLEQLEANKNKEIEATRIESNKRHEQDKGTIEKLDKSLSIHDNNIKRLSNWIAGVVTGLIIVVLFIVFITMKLYSKPSNCSPFVTVLYGLGWLAVGCWAVMSWAGWIPPKAQIHGWISNFFYEKLTNWLNKEKVNKKNR